MLQWIGNVVTTGSWRSSWYIEGVTQYLTLRHISQLDSHFLQNREDLDSYRLKAMSDVSIVPTNDIQGPLMFLVLEELIGEENLRNGIRKFLKKYAMKNAVEDDFWGCFEEFGKEKDMSVRATMREWTDQENYPLVTADFDHQTNSVKLSQKVFSYEHGKEGKWTIPITIEDAKNKTERHFMLKPDGVTVPVSASSDWFTVNVRGFYRVNYGVDTWTFLTQQLMEDHTVIKAAQRANLISDSWALVKANMLDVEIFLRLLDYMEKEKDYLPWIAFFGTTSELFSYSQQSENLPLYMTFFQEKIKNIYQRVAYNEDGSLGLSDRMLESGVVSQACQWEYAPCLAQAIRMFKRWKDNPEENKIPIQHLRQVMCIGVQDGSTADCMFVRDQLKMQPPSVAYRMRWALTCSSKPWVLQSMLNGITHSNDTTIDMLPSVLALLANNPEGVTIVNRFFKENCPTNTSVVSFSNYTSIPCHRVKQAVSDATDLTEFNKVNIGPSTNIHLKKQKIVEHIKDFWVNRNLDKGAKVLKELSYDKKKILSASKRLPQDIRPISYELVMKPDIYGDDPAKFTFTGSNTIQVLTVKDLRVISIHSYRLNIVNISVERHANDTAKTPSAVPVTSTTVDEDKQMFNILLAMKIPAGTSMTIKLDFEGDLKRQLNGFYLSSYYKRGNLTYLATTHFEPTFARKAFPCFDEPQLKATFQVTLLRKGHYKTISNTPRMKHVTQPDGWVADYYHRTPKMSTYLLAMIVCDFEFKSLNTSDNTQVGIWVRAEALGQTSLALNDSKSVLEFYARYFNASYPIAKLDLIAIPDFDAGAMENWGLVTYRETNLLYDPASQSKAHSDRVTYVVAHELAHQWFGNLVTMCWWNDLWLNEGFATYISTLGIQHAYPQTRQFEYFVLDTTHAALEADGSTSSHPLNVPIRNRHDIVSAFDSISYNKGASILHMLRISLGDTVFQQGLQRYISDHSYSNAQHNDLWLAFNQEAAVHHQTIDVNDTMEEWVNQMNYPVVFVQWNNSQLVLSQRIFQFESQSAVRCSTPAKQIVWKIPFTYTTDQEKNFTVTPHNIVWFTSERKTLNATTSRLTNQSWVLANLNQFGFYRVNYDLSNWESLVQQLNTDHSVLPVVTRAQLINDAWSLAKAGMLSQEIPFKLLDYMDRERDDIALRAIITEISFIKNILRKNSVYGMFEDLVKDKLKVTFNSLTDKHSNVYTTVFSAACQYNLPECIAEAKNQFNDWKSNISRNLPNPISVADIRMTCYCTGIRSGTKEDWHIMFQRYLRVLDAMEKRRLLYSLACTSQVWLLEKYLLIAMKGEEIRPQDFSIVLSAISSNPIGAEIIWKYIKQDWDTIRKKFGGGFALDNIVQAATSKFVDESQLKEVEQFMDDHSDLDSARQTFLAAIEEILTRVKWRNNNWTTLNTWLRTHT
ncbi:leucyl-cystinyl aminopeptidase-like isoform X1 [Argonauta hians]